jgi:hypothetical protein
MKNYLFLLLTAACISSCDVRKMDKVADDTGVQNQLRVKDSIKQVSLLMQEPTTVQLIDSVYNFGSITDGEKVEYSFRFKNTGNKPLIVTEAHASCGCTVPEKPEKPILPGEIGFIKVVFNSQNKSGHIEKAITVSSNVTPNFPDLKLTGEVKPK